MQKLTVVVPCHNESETLHLLFDALEREFSSMSEEHPNLSFDVIAIDDGSTDDTLEILKSYSPTNFKLDWISFSRNFGKEAAIYAGLKNSDGDYVAIMDADLQDPPSLLGEMYEYVSSGKYDSAATYRQDRKGEPPIRSFCAKMFYKFMRSLSHTDVKDGARDYRLMNRKMVNGVLEMSEYNRFTKGIFGWVGYKTKWIPYENVERAAGSSKWSFFKLLGYSIDGITAFTTKPLHIASFSGVLLCFVAIIVLLFIFFRAILFGDPVAGWPSLASIVIFIGGIQLFCLGIFGEYLAKTYLETKERPLFLVEESSFDDTTSTAASDSLSKRA